MLTALCLLSFRVKSLLGAVQGDCLSGCLLTLLLAGALCDLRIQLVIDIDRPNLPIAELRLPPDTEYADDVDFNDEEQENF